MSRTKRALPTAMRVGEKPESRDGWTQQKKDLFKGLFLISGTWILLHRRRKTRAVRGRMLLSRTKRALPTAMRVGEKPESRDGWTQQKKDLFKGLFLISGTWIRTTIR